MAEEGEVEVLPGLQQYDDLISSLAAVNRGSLMAFQKYHGCWVPEVFLPGALAFYERYKPEDSTDHIFLVSPPKSGTTWLKALAFATVTRKDHNLSSPDHPLLNKHPQDIVPMVDTFLAPASTTGQITTTMLVDSLLPHDHEPRKIVSTHLPYQILPETVTSWSSSSSGCRIVYVCREPKDTMVSGWHFFNAITLQGEELPVPFDDALEMFCNGMSAYGPIWDHWLGYWRESLKRPDKVLFLKYEDMKEQPVGNLRKLADFLGCPFSREEESELGVPEKIVSLCSFKKLSSNEVINKGECELKGFVWKYSSFFRKGEVGDWKNYFTTEMATKLDGIVQEKLHGSGLSFGNS